MYWQDQHQLTKLIFHGHNDLYMVETVKAEVVHEVWVQGQLKVKVFLLAYFMQQIKSKRGTCQWFSARLQ